MGAMAALGVVLLASYTPRCVTRLTRSASTDYAVKKTTDNKNKKGGV